MDPESGGKICVTIRFGKQNTAFTSQYFGFNTVDSLPALLVVTNYKTVQKLQDVIYSRYSTAFIPEKTMLWIRIILIRIRSGSRPNFDTDLDSDSGKNDTDPDSVQKRIHNYNRKIQKIIKTLISYALCVNIT